AEPVRSPSRIAAPGIPPTSAATRDGPASADTTSRSEQRPESSTTARPHFDRPGSTANHRVEGSTPGGFKRVSGRTQPTKAESVAATPSSSASGRQRTHQTELGVEPHGAL